MPAAALGLAEGCVLAARARAMAHRGAHLPALTLSVAWGCAVTFT